MYAVWMLGVQKLRTIIVLVVVACVSSCRTADVEHGPYIIQPGKPGESSQIIGVDEAVDLSRVQYRLAADVVDSADNILRGCVAQDSLMCPSRLRCVPFHLFITLPALPQLSGQTRSILRPIHGLP